MEDKKTRDLPEADLNPLGCEELNLVIAEASCLDEHVQTDEAEVHAVCEFEPLDWKLFDAMREREGVDDPFYGMFPPDVEDEEEFY